MLYAWYRVVLLTFGVFEEETSIHSIWSKYPSSTRGSERRLPEISLPLARVASVALLAWAKHVGGWFLFQLEIG